jgi:2-polyprenyl-6-methoxyphenol hydroxylase-like FAD-dependent oxidoreductase
LVSAFALAELGHEVVVVDPDPGPAGSGGWRRRGVMQFMHPHFFRHQVRECLETLAPPLWESVLAAGAVVNPPPPGAPPFMRSVSCRRVTFEAALRSAVEAHPGVTFVAGHAEQVLTAGGRVTGLVVDGVAQDVDVLVVANGRSGRFADEFRAPAEGGPCGLSYVSRMYRVRPGAEPLSSPAPLGSQHDGYQTIVFPQDAGTLSTLIVRPSADEALSMLWRQDCFEAAAALIPNLAPWADPERFEPITDVMRGGTLTNTYRGQGQPPAGVFFVGDAVCTTNPSAGRGVALGLMEVGALLDALRDHSDARDASAVLDAFCLAQVKPWYDDHVAADASIVRRYAGEDIDVDGPLSSDVIGAAAEADQSLMPVVGMYFGMVAPPSSLSAVEDRVREMLRAGWRPALAEGPSRDELVEALSAVSA